MKRDLREYARQTDRRLIIGALLILFLVGGGLIWYFYGGAGAGLGAVIAMSVKWPYSFWGLMAIPLAAFLAALLTVFLVYQLARVGRTVPTTNLILAGVAFSSFATSLTSFLMIRSTSEVRRALGWLLGGISLTGWDSVLCLLPYLALGLGALLLSGHALNLMQFGDDQAQQLGLNVSRAKRILGTRRPQPRTAKDSDHSGSALRSAG